MHEIAISLPPERLGRLRAQLLDLARLCGKDAGRDWSRLEAGVGPPDAPRSQAPRGRCTPRASVASTKQRYPLAVARGVADELVRALSPHCERIEIAGSIRRGKPMVGDVELLFVSSGGSAERAIAALLECGVIEIRGGFGEKNKFVRHIATGIPVDLFATSAEGWANSLVCRTGPAQSNIKIATAARRLGWRWNVYGAGFSRDGEIRAMRTEAEIFEFVGLRCPPPGDRQ